MLTQFAGSTSILIRTHTQKVLNCFMATPTVCAWITKTGTWNNEADDTKLYYFRYSVHRVIVDAFLVAGVANTDQDLFGKTIRCI